MRLIVARVGKPFGVKGEVTVHVVTDSPEQRLVAGAHLFASEDGPAGWTIEAARGEGSGRVLRISGVSSREDAEQLRDQLLWADVQPSDDGWYPEELVGRRCRSVSGTELGQVAAVEHHPAHDTLVIATSHGDVMVPFVSQIVLEVGEELILDPPAGLFE
ncbi:MAG: ribosome maturation factor RimM [Actinobacteria bacterium]|nr:ribosome maturation factor RimM [Actinomycetota bacterium]